MYVCMEKAKNVTIVSHLFSSNSIVVCTTHRSIVVELKCVQLFKIKMRFIGNGNHFEVIIFI